VYTKQPAAHQKRGIGNHYRRTVRAGRTRANNNRDDAVKTLEEAGFEIARTTGKSISIKDPDGGKISV